MGRFKHWVLLALWVLLSGSASCQSGSGGSSGPGGTGTGFTFAATGNAAAISIAGMALTAVVICMVETEECFPDWEALEAQAQTQARAEAAFTAGYHRLNKGEPGGLEMICEAAMLGDPKAQHFYGAYLLRDEPSRHIEALFWLKRSADQGHRAADLLLRHYAARLPSQMAASDAPFDAPRPIGPPTCGGTTEAADTYGVLETVRNDTAPQGPEHRGWPEAAREGF